MFDVCCVLVVNVRCSLFVVCCSLWLLSVGCVLCVDCDLMYVVRCSLFVARCRLCVGCGLLFAVCCLVVVVFVRCALLVVG